MCRRAGNGNGIRNIIFFILVVLLGCTACDDSSGGGCADEDKDGVCDSADRCPGYDDGIDSDGDGVPDGCDLCAAGDDSADADGDGVPDACDTCAAGDDGADGDGDGVPDACDVCPLDMADDSDQDGVCDSDDLCPGNDDTIDSDGDGVPDGCDLCPGGDDGSDVDGDGIPDACDDIDCILDTECPEAMYCDGAICLSDVCTPGDRHCAGLDVLICSPNGGGETVDTTCGGFGAFESLCVESEPGEAYCSCQADWDCPEGLECLVDRCVGPAAPTCLAPVGQLTDLLPSPEIIWGGDPPYPGTNTYAVNSPFMESAQVLMTPLVINLDDDNGDGRIDERDFPEILFISFVDQAYTTNGVLRAIHGGGEGKGTDFFATCGSTTWQEGDALPATCTYVDADLDPSTHLAAGDLDGDGIPEIVGVTESNAVNIYSNKGVLIATSGTISISGADPAVSIANVDGEGFAEIIVERTILTLQHDASGLLQFGDRFAGTGSCCYGTNGQGPITCVADLTEMAAWSSWPEVASTDIHALRWELSLRPIVRTTLRARPRRRPSATGSSSTTTTTPAIGTRGGMGSVPLLMSSGRIPQRHPVLSTGSTGFPKWCWSQAEPCISWTVGMGVCSARSD